MFYWEDVRHFLAVAECGTLSGAARLLKVDHATVRRRLTAFEAAVGLTLIDRLPRSCRLTAVGKQVFKKASTMEEASQAVQRIAVAAQTPQISRVVLSAPPVLAPLLASHLGEFRMNFPHIKLSLSADGHQVSLSRREADVALRLVRPDEPTSVVRQIGRMDFALYCYRQYVHRKASSKWQFIAFDESFAHMPQQLWLLDIAGKRPVACELNYIIEHQIAARSGVGVAGLPRFLGDGDQSLVRLEESAPPFERGIWLVVHKDLRRNSAVRCVMDFVDKIVKNAPMLGRQSC